MILNNNFIYLHFHYAFINFIIYNENNRLHNYKLQLNIYHILIELPNVINYDFQLIYYLIDHLLNLIDIPKLNIDIEIHKFGHWILHHNY